LKFVQLSINSIAQREKLLMRPAFPQLSLVHHENPVRALNGGKAVRDHQ
jgi:hypothetical protein